MRKLMVAALFLFAARLTTEATEYVTGGVDLASSGSLLASYGWAEIPDPIRGRVLQGKHYIYDNQTYAMIGFVPFSIDCEQNVVGITKCRYSNNLTAGGSPGRCYRAMLQGTIVSLYGFQVASNAFSSGTICIPATGAGGGGECNAPGGPIATSIDSPDRPRSPWPAPARIDPTAPLPELEAEPPEAAEEPGIAPISPQGAKSCGSSPILIDLEREGFPLSDDPVRFDLDADGTPEKTNWTAAGSSVAFLTLDRNGNGTIDDGTELFGSSTPLSTGEKVPYGYIALGEYDLNAFGGNFDGFIGPDDAVWAKLRLWVDRNHDGVSQPDELLTLDQSGILKVLSDYEISSRKDRFGNRFVAKGKAWRENRRGDPKEMKIWDVVFVRR